MATFCGERFWHPTSEITVASTDCRRSLGHDGRHANIGFTELVSDYFERVRRGKPRWRVMEETTPTS